MKMDLLDVTYARDTSAARRLRKLLQPDVVSSLVPVQHPLGAGFRALTKSERGGELAPVEKSELATLDLTARTLFELERSWWPDREQLVKDLRKASECMSLLFELDSARLMCKGTAARVVWSRYVPGSPDFLLKGTGIGVECKLLRKEDRSYLDVMGDAIKQHASFRGPLVVSVGVSAELEEEEVREILAVAPTWRTWFQGHPRIAAGVIFSPQRLPVDRIDTGAVKGTPFGYGSVTTIRSLVAKPPLPPGYTFRFENRQTAKVF